MPGAKETSGSSRNLLNFGKFWTKLTIFMTITLIKLSLYIGRTYIRDKRNVIFKFSTHGFNRTGYIICLFLFFHLGFTMTSALRSFSEVRQGLVRIFFDQGKHLGWELVPENYFIFELFKVVYIVSKLLQKCMTLQQITIPRRTEVIPFQNYPIGIMNPNLWPILTIGISHIISLNLRWLLVLPWFPHHKPCKIIIFYLDCTF